MIRKDISGKSYGRLSVRSHVGINKSGNHLWRCSCECGRVVDVTYANLTSGHTMSCGCLQKERTSEAKKTHGLYWSADGKRSRLSRIWSGMKERCFNEKCAAFRSYGGAGITMCEEWLEYRSFHDWATMNGFNDGMTIDRIDNDKGYSPSNCRIATRRQQSRNRRNIVMLTHDGITKPMFQWAEELGLNKGSMASRRRMGWSDSEIITTPFRRWGR